MAATFSHGAAQKDNRTLAVTIPANANQVAYVILSSEDTSVTGVSIDGTPMTQIASGPWNGVAGLVRIFRLVNPPTGSVNVTVGGSGTPDSLAYALCVVQGAHQTTPNTTPVIDDYLDEGFDTTSDVDITATDADGLIIGVAIQGESNPDFVPQSPLVARAEAIGTGYGRSINLATRASAASGTLTLQWTHASNNPTNVAIEVLPAAAGTPVSRTVAVAAESLASPSTVSRTTDVAAEALLLGGVTFDMALESVLGTGSSVSRQQAASLEALQSLRAQPVLATESRQRIARALGVRLEAAGAVTAPPVRINGHDLSPFAAFLGYLSGTPALEGHLTGPRQTLTRLKVPGRPGERITDRQVDAAELTVRLVVKGDTAQEARENWAKVFWIIRSRDPAELVFGDRPDRMRLAEYAGPADAAMLGTASLIQRHLPISIPFLAADPRWFATEETVVGGIQTTPVQLPVGDAEIYPKTRIQGPTGAVILLELLNAASTVVGSLEITTTPLGASEWIVIDHERFTIHRNTTGNFGEGARMLGEKTAGDWFRIGANDGDPINGLSPSARCSSGTAEFSYLTTWAV